MTPIWKLQDAKAQFSRIVENAINDGPQYVTRHGSKAVVVIAVDEYEELISNKPPFKDFLLQCPKMSDTTVFERKKDFPRRIDL